MNGLYRSEWSYPRVGYHTHEQRAASINTELKEAEYAEIKGISGCSVGA